MSGDCELCGEHTLDCICHCNKKYEDAKILIKKMFLDFLIYKDDHYEEHISKDQMIDDFIEEFIINEED